MIQSCRTMSVRRRFLTSTTKRICVLFLAAALAALAQVNKSNLTGIVRDTSGGVVAGADVRLVNLDTQVVRTEQSDANGIYRFILADLGSYRIEVQQKGFRRFARSGIILNAGETTTADVTL